MLTPEQVKTLKADLIKKRDKALEEYHRCCGFVDALRLFDGSIEVVNEEKEEDNGATERSED